MDALAIAHLAQVHYYKIYFTQATIQLTVNAFSRLTQGML